MIGNVDRPDFTGNGHAVEGHRAGGSNGRLNGHRTSSGDENRRSEVLPGAIEDHQSGSGDLREQILGLEAQIEELAETIESCRKIIQISKAFIVVGGLLIAAITIGLIRFDPMLMIGALTAVVGGIVALGSNWSTSQQAVSTLKAAEAQRAELISKIDLRVVESRDDGPLRLN